MNQQYVFRSTKEQTEKKEEKKMFNLIWTFFETIGKLTLLFFTFLSIYFFINFFSMPGEVLMHEQKKLMQKEQRPKVSKTICGKTINEAKEIFFTLVKAQDARLDDPQWAEDCITNIAIRYCLSKNEVRKIIAIGVWENWPMPPMPTHPK